MELLFLSIFLLSARTAESEQFRFQALPALSLEKKSFLRVKHFRKINVFFRNLQNPKFHLSNVKKKKKKKVQFITMSKKKKTKTRETEQNPWGGRARKTTIKFSLSSTKRGFRIVFCMILQWFWLFLISQKKENAQK